jgi:predicted phage terminase large subunit-like protein
MKNNLAGLTYYISVDLAISERDTADYTAIAVIGVNENNHWFLIDGCYGRYKPDDTIDKIFMYVAKYRPYSVVLEKVAFQMAMKTFIYNEQVKRGLFFGVDMISRPTHKNSKLTVLKSFQPIVEMGRFWIPEDIMENFTEELLQEMSMITVDKILAKHDDLIDAISQLTLIDIIASTSIKDETGLDIMDEDTINPYIF